MWLLEEGVMEVVPVGLWYVIILLTQPPVPLGRDHVSVGTSDREIVVVLNPSPLVGVYYKSISYAGRRSIRSTCCRTRPFRRVWFW